MPASCAIERSASCAPPRAANESGHRLEEIDVLRGLVIIMVLISSYFTRYQTMLGHTQDVSLIPGIGFLALQLFLALSGYRLILDVAQADTPAAYLQSRLIRYLPALWPAVLLACALPWLSHLSALRSSPAAIPANLLMAADLVGMPVIDPSFWRLKIELLVSIAIGLLWFACGRRISPWALLGGLAIEAALAHGAEPVHHHSLTFAGFLTFDLYLPPTAFGIALCHLIQRPRALAWWSVAGVSLCLIPAINTPAHAVIVVAAMLVLALAASGRLGMMRSWKSLIRLGQLSYPIYVAHQIPGFVLIHGLESAGAHPAVAVLAASAAAVCCGALLHHVFEVPARSHGPALCARLSGLMVARPIFTRPIFVSGKAFAGGLENQAV